MDLQKLKENKEAPEWLTDEGLTTLENGYLLPGETPKDMWSRVCSAAAQRLNKPELAEKFFELFWFNWLCGATPVLSNMGTSRGLPISCNSIHVGDSVRSIFDKQTELAVLSKNGAGVGIYVGDVRGRGASISGNGKSEGVIPWLKCYDSTTVAVSQGSTRRGASAVYLPIEHSDIEEFINIRRPVGDVNRRCLNLHHAVCIGDNFMQAVQNGGSHERNLWKEVLRARFETGEPYLFFTDNVERQKPECYVKNNLDIKTSNICVTGDQIVVTSKGLKTVYNLYKSQEKLTLFDGVKSVEASEMKLIEKNAKVFKITTNEGRTHTITDYHKLMTDKGLVQCKDLKVGDKVAVQRQEGLFGNNNSVENAFIFGALHNNNESVKTKALRDIKIFNLNFIENIIPEWIWNGNKNTQMSFFKGLFEDCQSLENDSNSFLIDVQIILSNLGICCKINNNKLSLMIELTDNPFDTIKSVDRVEDQDVYCTTVNSKEHVWVCNSFITSNCNEIYLYTNPNHTFVCCLSSMNLFKYDEWKNTNAVQLSIWFLDAVIQEYIEKARNIYGLEAAVRFAEKSRAVGLGVLGWHSLLQKKKLPFDSFESMRLNGEIFRHMQKEAVTASKDLAKEYGEPEWCKGFGIRNTHQLAVAPTVSNSIISGSVSAGIEPISANVVALKTAKGTFMRSNPLLKQALAEKGLDNIDTWKQINENSGSVAELKGLTDEEKEVFLTAREINQHAIVKQAGQRQKYIDQGQSVNLFFAKNSDPKYIHSVHMLAWEEGLKGLYYCRSEAALKGDSVNRQKDECKACEG